MSESAPPHVFEYVEPSRPQWTPPGLHFLTFQSPALGMRGTVTIYIPPGCETRDALPMVLLLHGVYGDHWSWCFMGGAHVRLQNLIDAGSIPPMALVMPSDGLLGEGSGYVNHAGRRCEDWTVHDVIGCCRQAHPCFRDSRVYIAGFSMGGFGALRLGAKYPEVFHGISAHSAPTRYEHLERFRSDPKSLTIPLDDSERSALYWMRKNRASMPPLRFDCGNEDILVRHSRELHEELEKEGIPHRYDEFPGRHSWDYCHEHLGDTLAFFGSLEQR